MWKEFIDTLLLLNVYDVYKYWPTVRHTANGPVAGIQQTSSLGQEYYAFKGVPYAEPPITGKDKYTDEYVDRRFKVRRLRSLPYSFMIIKKKTCENIRFNKIGTCPIATEMGNSTACFHNATTLHTLWRSTTTTHE